MTDELFAYYERELSYLRSMSERFAKAHPKEAGRMRLGAGEIEDPHVTRLIQAVAFLNARTHHRLDDEFPQISGALLETLYPQFLAPVPSLGVVQFEPAPGLAAGGTIPAGTELSVSRNAVERVHVPCTYRTCYETRVLPIRVAKAQLTGIPIEVLPTAKPKDCAAVLHVELARLQGSSPFDELLQDDLRFHLAGTDPEAQALYECLFSCVSRIAVATGPKDDRPLIFTPEALEPVGFAAENALWPRSSRSHPAHHLLAEYLAFPRKFLFVDLHGDLAPTTSRARDSLHLYFFISVPRDERMRSSLEHLKEVLNERALLLGCTPVVNLFRRAAERIKLNHTQHEIPVIPDSRRPLDYEVYAVEEILTTEPERGVGRLRSMHGLDHALTERIDSESTIPSRGFYRAIRRSGMQERPGGGAPRVVSGVDVYLEIVADDLDTRLPAETTLTVSTLCTNRDLPNRLPPADRLEFEAGTAGALAGNVKPLVSMTPPRSADVGRRDEWGLISSLSLNLLSITGGEEGAAALREILRTHDFVGDASTRSMIDSIVKVEAIGTTLRVVRDQRAAYVRGTAVTVHLDERRISGHGAHLFAALLDRFIGLYCSINSFVQTTVRSNLRDGDLARWPARSGTGPLV